MTEVELVSPFVLEYAYKRSLGPVLSRFFTALRDRRIVGVRTKAGRVLAPPVEYDPQTGESVEDFVTVGPKGTVTTWCWVSEAISTHPLDKPFAWALIRLDGADTAMLHALDAEEADISTGMRVQPRWRPEPRGHITDIECFEAIDTQQGQGANHQESTENLEAVTRFKSPTRLEYTVTAGGVTADFLRGILNRELIGKRCPQCSKVYIPPRGSCPTCGVPTTEAVAIGERGTITTFSVVRIPFEGQMLQPPYACAHIVLDGADVPLLHIVGDCDVDDVRMGMRVEAVWADELLPTLASVLYFRPSGEADADYASYRLHVEGSE